MAYQEVANLYQLCQRGKEDNFAEYVARLSDQAAVLNSVTPGGVGFTFLHVACDRGLPKVVAFLLNKKVDPNRPCLIGETPLFKAVHARHASCVLALSHHLGKLELGRLDREQSEIIEEANQTSDPHLKLLIKLIAATKLIEQLPECLESRASAAQPRHHLDKIKRWLGSVRRCRRELIQRLQSDKAEDRDLTQRVLDRSVKMLKDAAALIFQKGQFVVIRALVQTQLDSHHLNSMKEDWLPCKHPKGTSEMSPEQERIVLCVLIVNLAKSGHHRLLFHLLGQLRGYSLAGENPPPHCTKCLQLWSYLARQHHRDIQGILAVAFTQALESSQNTTSGHILWLMAEDNDSKLHLDWHSLGLRSAIDEPLLDGLVLHKSINAHSITIADNDMLDRLPSAVLHMDSLTILDISGTSIGPQLPADLFLLPHLQTMKASRCKLQSWPPISKVQPALAEFILEENNLADVSPAFSSSQLCVLNLAQNSLESITPDIFRIISLTHLNVSGNPITDLPVGLLSMVNLANLNLTNTPLRSPLSTYRHDIIEIKKTLRAELEQVQNEPLKKIIVIGDSEQSQGNLVKDLAAISTLSQVVFINCGSDRSFNATQSMFHRGSAHYLVLISAHGNLADVDERTRILAAISEYRCCICEPGVQRTLLFALAVQEDVTALPSELQRTVRQDGHRIFLLSCGARRQNNLQDLGKAISNLPATSVKAPAPLCRIRSALQRERAGKELPLFVAAEDFQAKICSSAEVYTCHFPSWLDKLHDFLLVTGEGAVLRNVHPLIPVAVCTDLCQLLFLLRKLTGADRAGSRDSFGLHPVADTIVSLLSVESCSLSTVSSTAVDDFECLWALAEKLSLAHRITSDQSFLPLLCGDLAADQVARLHSTSHTIYRVCTLSSSPSLTSTNKAKAWHHFQAEVLALQSEITTALVHSEGVLSAGRHVNPLVWKSGVAFMCNAEVVAMAQLDPDIAFSPTLHSSILLTIAERVSIRCLGLITDRLEHICEDLRDFIGEVIIQHGVPCQRCLKAAVSADGGAARVCYVPAFKLLDQFLQQAEGKVTFNCSVHGRENVTKLQLADFLLLDLNSIFPPCARGDIDLEPVAEEAGFSESVDTPDAGPSDAQLSSALDQQPYGQGAVPTAMFEGSPSGLAIETQQQHADEENIVSSFASVFSVSSSSPSDLSFHSPHNSSASSRATSASSAASNPPDLEVARPDSNQFERFDASEFYESASPITEARTQPIVMPERQYGMQQAAECSAEDTLPVAGSGTQNDLQQSSAKDGHTAGNGTYATVSTNSTYKGEKVAVKVFKADELKKNPYLTVNYLRRELIPLSLVEFSAQFLRNVHPMLTSREDAAVVMERGGQTMLSLLQSPTQPSGEPLPRLVWYLMMLQVSRGLADLHSVGVVHRDVKSDNVLLRECQRSIIGCCLIDFHTSVQLRAVRSVLRRAGADEYAGPEISNTDSYGLQADVYSLGLLFLEALTGWKLKDFNNERTRAGKIKRLRTESHLNFQQMRSILIAANMCLNDAPACRPLAKEVVRFLGLADSYFMMDNCTLPSSVSVTSLTAPAVRLGLGRASLVCTTCTEDTESQGNYIYSLITMPLPPAEHCGECLRKGKGKIWSYCVSDWGLTFVSRRKAIEIFGRLDCVKSEHAAKPISIPEPAWCMESFENLVFAGLENGDIYVLECVKEKGKVTVKRRPTITCSPESAVKQILPVKCGNAVKLFCLSAKSRRSTELSVKCLTPSECGYDISQLSVDQAPGDISGPIRHLAKSSISSDVVWGVAGTSVLRWSTKTQKCVLLNENITRHLSDRQRFFEAQQGREEIMRKEKADLAALRDKDSRARKIKLKPVQRPSEILSFCAVNGVLWLGTRLGLIVLLAESATDDELRLLAVLEGHCKDARQLFVVHSSLHKAYENSRKRQNPKVVSVGIHCALECPTQGLALHSPADSLKPHTMSSACHITTYTALVWEACSPQEISESLEIIPLDS